LPSTRNWQPAPGLATGPPKERLPSADQPAQRRHKSLLARVDDPGPLTTSTMSIESAIRSIASSFLISCSYSWTESAGGCLGIDALSRAVAGTIRPSTSPRMPTSGFEGGAGSVRDVHTRSRGAFLNSRWNGSVHAGSPCFCNGQPLSRHLCRHPPREELARSRARSGRSTTLEPCGRLRGSI
jgi:hypothetical protein